MFKKQLKLKADQIRWRQFSRKGDAVLCSLHKEISIGVLSVATLTYAVPASASAEMAMRPATACGTEWTDLHEDSDALPEDMDSIILAGTEVVATRVPIPAAKAARLVQVIDRKQIEASAVQSVNDLLKLSAGVDVRQRGPFGIQTDVSVNGGTDDQLTVLLNGVNITNPHTGHLTVDLPVSIDEVERIEIIEGGASRVYGAQAFSGVINIVTRKQQGNDMGLSARAGSFGTVGTAFHVGGRVANVTNRLSGGYDFSDGGTENSDFKKANAFYRGMLETAKMDLNWQAGFSSMKYGANTFYGTGSRAQYEENKRYTVSANGEYKGRVHIMPQLYWTRSLDHYVWTRSNPEAYQNFHQTNVYGASINAYTEWALGKTAVGVEWRSEEILSTRLGREVANPTAHKVPGTDDNYYKYQDSRSNFGVYLEHDVLLRDWTVSVGCLANSNTSVDGGFRFYPGVDLSYRPYGVDGLKIYASFNQSLRVATYTDLYYNGPGIQGNSNLKPERSSDFALGASYAHSLLSAQVKGFFRHGTDMIDWVRYTGESLYTVANSDIDCAGVEATVGLNFQNLYSNYTFVRNLNVSYCFIDKYRTNREQSATYASDLNYQRHKLVASLGHSIAGPLTAQWDFTVRQRNGQFDNVLTGQPQDYGTHALLDLKLQWTKPAYQLYLQANNLTNRQYYDVSNVQQPGFWFMGGVKLNIGL